MLLKDPLPYFSKMDTNLILFKEQIITPGRGAYMNFNYGPYRNTKTSKTKMNFRFDVRVLATDIDGNIS